jgi:hypothetical protein
MDLGGGYTMEIMNQTRGYAYLLGVLKNQQADTFCCSCNSFMKTLAAVKETLANFEAQHVEEIKNVPGEFLRLFTDPKSGLAQIRQPENPVRQKKAGNCKLPEGVCFTKSALAVLQKI